MSKFITIETQFKCKEAIIATLKQMGFNEIEQGHNLKLYGYQNDVRTERADIVVRKKYIGPVSNDLGFARQANGTSYKMIVSDFDHNYNIKVNEFKQNYAYNTIKLKMPKQGYSIAQEQRKDNKIKLVLRKW